ncbi:MOSC domain-containing protein [Tunicatimonas pelagia]|uniref:MOSC domain-containing protein n=1 Tax=Tunicatimonas pelagia TaxID=931531 RepID=UPI002665743F|nr:MOSC N-terminal beta barrel domain-containing protein [Tunicatimonas pelagia]WKN46312.1 MOSC domain-containing protein [Tunicatimonas pelagia]
MSLQLSEIYIYPIKSLRGIAVSEALLTDRGLAYDRRWMLVDGQNFLTQRDFPQMAQMAVTLQNDSLKVSSPNQPHSLTIPLLPNAEAPITTVQVWGDLATGQHVSEEADAWFSDALGHSCTLVYMPDGSSRSATGRVSSREQLVSFADGYPALLIGQSSLDDLNNHFDEPVPMNRFRPNLVFIGGEAYEEDQWHEFTVGNAQCWAEKPCARCTVITIDQSTAKRGKEPLATLSKYRKQGNKVLFGQNIMFEVGKTISIGDPVQVQTYKPDIS